MKKIALVSLALVISVGAGLGAASAFDKEDLEKMKTTKECAGCDLSYAELPSADLSGADLSGANLSGADLSGANLTDATWIDGSWCRQGSTGRCSR